MRYAAFLIALFLALPAFAQEAIETPALFISVSPPYPRPNEAVTLTVQTPLADLSQRVITWKNADKTVAEGEGETTYRFTAPSNGERADISVRASGIDEVKSISIIPLSVDLLWESDTYAPGLYRGRHLPSLGANITLQAVPHFSKDGTEIPASQLIYTWTQMGETILSGRGKSSLSVPVSQFAQENTVSVSVQTPDKLLGANRTVSVPTVVPQVQLYFEHPLYGTMYHNAVARESAISDTEMTFTAVPYFAYADSPNDRNFSYIWRVNKADVDENEEHPETLTISAGPEGGIGLVELSLTHKKNFRLDAHASWNVIFGSVAGEGPSVDPFR